MADREYREITLPGGTFRQYPDDPYTWHQILQPGERSVAQKIEDAYNAGLISKDNKQ
jgi:hypothetical protein